MTSSHIQYVMIAFYIVLMIMTIYEHNAGKAMYWLGAIILSIGVLMMK